MLHAIGRTREIPKLLIGVVRTFTAAGKLTGALTALAYLRDAAAAGQIAPMAFPHVRRISRLRRRPLADLRIASACVISGPGHRGVTHGALHEVSV